MQLKFLHVARQGLDKSHCTGVTPFMPSQAVSILEILKILYICTQLHLRAFLLGLIMKLLLVLHVTFSLRVLPLLMPTAVHYI